MISTHNNSSTVNRQGHPLMRDLAFIRDNLLPQAIASGNYRETTLAIRSAILAMKRTEEEFSPLLDAIPIPLPRFDQDEKPVVYLACPYSHESQDVMRHRFIQASQAAAWLFRQGYGVVSPISMGHPIAKYGKTPGTWEAWKRTDLRMIEACDAMAVLNLEGMRESVGVRAEVEYAVNRGMPVSMLTFIGKDYVSSSDMGLAVLNAPRGDSTRETRHG